LPEETRDVDHEAARQREETRQKVAIKEKKRAPGLALPYQAVLVRMAVQNEAKYAEREEGDGR
jgi:hypothetical protein